MSEFTTQLQVMAVALALCLAGPLTAAGFLKLRRRRRRKMRRSPIGIDLLRAPGHTLREELDEANGDATIELLMLGLSPLMVAVMFLSQAQLSGLPRAMSFAWAYALFVVLHVAFAIVRLMKAGNRLDNLKAGYDAEVAVGQELDQLMRRGAVVFHDFPAEGFNIDHVVIARQGIFAVETKGHTKPADLTGKAGATVVFDGRSLAFPRWSTKEPLEQAERQAAWLGKWASSATGDKLHAVPVVALPGWFVDRKGRGDVRVYSGKELAGLLEARGAAPLAEDALQRVVHQVEQRCRTVTPRYVAAGATAKRA